MTASDAQVRRFIESEAELLDTGRLYEWLALFRDDAVYWIPATDGQERPGVSASIVHDNHLALEERVHHLMETQFPSQSPPSKTLHFVTNARAETVTVDGEERVRATSNQLVAEVRIGDFTQAGLGELRLIPARVLHDLVADGDGFSIVGKTVRLLEAGLPMTNLTFLV